MDAGILNSDGHALALEQDLRVKLDGMAAMAGHLMRSLTSEGFSDQEALSIVIASLGECTHSGTENFTVLSWAHKGDDEPTVFSIRRNEDGTTFHCKVEIIDRKEVSS